MYTDQLDRFLEEQKRRLDEQESRIARLEAQFGRKDPEELISVRQAAEEERVSEASIFKRIARHKVTKHYRGSRRFLVRRGDLTTGGP